MIGGAFLSTRRDGPLLIVTIERAQVMNALHPPAHRELQAVFDDFAGDDDLWIAILTGAGGHAFCAGNDLRYQAAHGLEPLPPGGFAGLTRRFDLDKAVIAAVDGVAMGGGFETALACDIIVAGERARFALPELRVGMAALAGGLLRLPAAIGIKRAMPLILTGRAVSATEGERLGFVSEVFAAGTALERALALAREIGACGPAAVRAARQVAMRGLDMPLADAMAAQGEWPAVKAMRVSPDYSEGARAFAEKRPPEWSGR